MRTFHAGFLLIFIFVYLFVTILGNKSLVKSFRIQSGHIFWLWLPTILIFSGFVILFIYPFTPRTFNHYKIYFYFNFFLICDILYKIILSLGFLFSYFLKVKNNTWHFMSFILATGALALCSYGFIAGRNEIVVNKVAVNYTNLPAGFNHFRIVQISDIHLGSFSKNNRLLKTISQRISDLKPDIIMFTGDMFNNFSSESAGWEDEIREIGKIAPVYSILGNHDYGDYSNWKRIEEKSANFEGIVEFHGRTGFNLLKNRHETIVRGKDTIYIAGVENWGHPPFPQYARLGEAFNGIPDNAFTVLLSHDPAHWDSKISKMDNVALTLSGHTHGFQLGVKIAGIPFSPAWLVRKQWGGLYNRNNNNYLYVNQGIGIVAIPWRIDMPAEITLLELKRIEINGK